MNGAAGRVRPLAELVDVPDPAWPALWLTLTGARVPVRVLDVDPAAAEQSLYRLQVGAASVLGAIVLHTGGLLVDHGWVRLLGGGAAGLPDVATASDLGDPADADATAMLVVGLDVLGGRFAVAGPRPGGVVDVRPGEVCYWGPDTLQWDGLGIGHTAFVHAAVDGRVEDLYEPFRWPGWQDDVSALAPDEGLALWPPPFSREGQNAVAVTRRTVPLAELAAFYADMARQLDGPADAEASLESDSEPDLNAGD